MHFFLLNFYLKVNITTAIRFYIKKKKYWQWKCNDKITGLGALFSQKLFNLDLTYLFSDLILERRICSLACSTAVSEVPIPLSAASETVVTFGSETINPLDFRGIIGRPNPGTAVQTPLSLTKWASRSATLFLLRAVQRRHLQTFRNRFYRYKIDYGAQV